MRRGLVLANWEAEGDPELLVEAAVVAEQAGWDGVFLADHLIFPPPETIGGTEQERRHLPFPDPFITLAGIAARTDTIRLGTWVTPVPRRQPWQTARDLATLDRLARGRVMLGVGLGRRPDYERFGRPWDLRMLGRMRDEALELMAGLWTGEPVTFHGEYYTADEAVVLPTPHQRPRIPIIIGGLWPNKTAFRRGARWDGIIPHFPGDGVLPGERGVVPEQQLSEMLTYYRSVAADPGEILVLADPPGGSREYAQLCAQLGVTWLLTAKWDGDWLLDLDRIRAGPPD